MTSDHVLEAQAMPAAFRVPTEPYPGLRPFLDHESALLLGRGRQIDEVIARLGKSGFVAVIGGSGSGKSSLIRAGVVPALRGFGIRSAGDYWVPVVWTPGTTKRSGDVEASPALPPPSTPVTRLAWKFSKVLAPAAECNARRREREAARRGEAPPASADAPPSAEVQEAARRNDIAALFRQGGFSRLVNEMSEELPHLGPQPEDARFLFVIDQFEELFHPNNHGNADAAAVIDAVVNHFFDPNPRCFVVLTMRSEHLADCAGYLELPDAINASSYLVRRLDDRELREAIEGPAKYFLRIQRRGQMAGGDLPDDVVFDADVVQRLLDDVGAVTGDPDHLPLLQHVLARTWESACVRSTQAAGARRVPGRIEWADLEHAVDPAARMEAGWLRRDTSVNALRDSLENWAQDAYRQRPPDEQAQIDRVLRQLAFKDPNNGQYTQQRLEVDNAHVFDGPVQPKERLRALLHHGFLDSVNYLFWDTENPEHVTLKVSHESFIRGWRHFRDLVDEEANHFDEFVGLLRKCVSWSRSSDARTQQRNLLEKSDFDRLQAAGLVPVLSPGQARDDWFDTLAEYRDRDRFAGAREALDAFAQASRDRLNRVNNARRRLVGSVALAILVAAVVLPVAGYSYFVQSPAMDRIADFARARDLVQRNADKGQYNSIDDPGKLLANLVLAAATFDKGEQSNLATALSERVADVFRGWGFNVTGTKRLLALTTSEPEANGTIRRMLTNNAWPVSVAASAPRPPVRECTLVGPDGRSVSGQVFRRRGSDRAILVVPPAGSGGPTTLYEVTMERQGERRGSCSNGRTLLDFPPEFDVAILFDENTEHVAVAVAGGGASPGNVTLYTVTWAPSPDNKSLIASLRLRSQVTDPQVVSNVRNELAQSEAGRQGARACAVPTLRLPGGAAAAVDGQGWRLFSEAGQRIEAERGNWVALAEPGPVCGRLEEVLKAGVQPGFQSVMHEHGDRCFEIQRGNPAGMGGNDGVSPPDEAVLVAVYAKPLDVDKLRVGDAPPAAIASLSGFGRFRREGGATWLVGEGGEFDGWIARQEEGAQDKRVYAAPWSTPALKRLAQSVLPPAGVAANATANAAARATTSATASAPPAAPASAPGPR